MLFLKRMLEKMFMTVDEVKKLLKIYYDIPQIIAEEFSNKFKMTDAVTFENLYIGLKKVYKGMGEDYL